MVMMTPMSSPQAPIAITPNKVAALNFKKMGQQELPDATPLELQAFQDSFVAGSVAGKYAFDLTMALTQGNKSLAWEKMAEAVFDVSPKVLAATPEGQSFQQRVKARSNPFQVPTQPQAQPGPVQMQPVSAIPNNQPITV